MAETRAVNINDLDLAEDEVQFDASADATEKPAPVPDGIYRTKPRFAGDKADWQASVDEGKLRALWPRQNVQFVIVDGEYKDQVVFGMTSTMIMRNGASMIGTILAKMGLGDEVSQCRGHKELAQLFERALEQGREVGIETEWEASVKVAGQGGAKDKYQTVKKGMRNFPMNGDGKYKHVIEVKDQGEVSAQATIKHFVEA